MSAERSPMFTVVIPLFNKAAHISATLASVAAQTFDDYDVVVVDDGSRDDGPARVEAAGGPVRLVHQANAGPGAARNRGIAEARGTWVAFLDADDLWTPGHLATLARTIEACPDADLVANGFIRGERAEVVGDATGGAPRYVDFLAEYGLIWTSAVAVRTSVLRALPFGHAWPGEDVELWTRLAMDHRIAVNPARTAVYVQRTGGAMDSQDTAVILPIADQPIFATIDAILADSEMAARHSAVAGYRNALLLDYVRPSLFNGRTAVARDYLRALRRDGGRAPRLYRVLAHLPGPVARTGSRMFAAAKRLLSRRR